MLPTGGIFVLINNFYSNEMKLKSKNRKKTFKQEAYHEYDQICPWFNMGGFRKKPRTNIGSKKDPPDRPKMVLVGLIV